MRITEKMEQVKEEEKKTLEDLDKELYRKQRHMTTLQAEIEDITGQNQALELDFENEIENKNKN